MICASCALTSTSKYSLEDGTTCQDCPTDCLTCFGGQCTSCKAGKKLDHSNYSCVVDCPANTAVVDFGKGEGASCRGPFIYVDTYS